jgi:hypothetical protein
MQAFVAKMTVQEKAARASRRAKRRLETQPTIDELGSEQAARLWCSRHGKTPEAQARVVRAVTTGGLTRDLRDLRSVPAADRVPRSLETRPQTPPHFWDVSL